MMKTVMTTASATLQLGNVILQMMKEPNYINRLGILINTVNEQWGQSPCGHFPSASREDLSMGGES